MAEGSLGGVLGEEDEKPEVESRDTLAGAEAFASAVAAKLAGNDPEVARRTADFLIDQSQLLKTSGAPQSRTRGAPALSARPGS